MKRTTKPKRGFMDGYKTYDTSEGYGSRGDWQRAFGERMTKDDARAILGEAPETPYSILGVSMKATKAEIKKAFRALLMRWHPDKNPGNTAEAETMTKKILAAYELIGE